MKQHVPSKFMRRVSLSIDMDISNHMPFDTIYFFQWEDILCPFSWLKEISFQPNQINSENQMILYLLHELDKKIAILLTRCQSLGIVYVIFHETIQTIQFLCHEYFPQTFQLFFSSHSNISLISTQLTPTIEWYIELFHSSYSRAIIDKQNNIAMILCGQNALRFGCLSLLQHGTSFTPKILTFSKINTSVLECMDYLVGLLEGLEDISFHKTGFDISI